MYGLTRGVLTLIGAAVAGVLLWVGANVVSDEGTLSARGHWAIAGLVAAAGLTMALSQLLGGWTKWGWPRVSGNVFLIAFLPVLVVGGWIIAAGEPGEHWIGSHVRSWSGDLGLGGLVDDLTIMFPAIAFGIGLVFGFTFDTTGPRVRKRTSLATPVMTGAKESAPATEAATDDRQVHLGDGEATTPEAEPAPRTREPTRS